MKSPCLLLLGLLSAVAHGQDDSISSVIVATKTRLLMVNASADTTILQYDKLAAISGHGTVPLAVDPENYRVFYSLPQLRGSQRVNELMYVNVDRQVRGNSQPVMLFDTDTHDGYIRGLAYDEKSGILYWTNRMKNSLWQCTVASGCQDATLLMNFSNKEGPTSIAVDSCRGYLYWTNNNHRSPSVNRMNLISKNWETIVNTSIYMPNGIAVDPSGRGKLYWTDDSEGDAYKIMSSELDGNNMNTEYRGFDQTPMDLTFSPPSQTRPKGTLYWSDWNENAVWTLELNNQTKGPNKLEYSNSFNDRPMGVVAMDSLSSRATCTEKRLR